VVAADVDRAGMGAGGEGEDAVDGVIGVADRAGLPAVAGDGDRLAGQRLADKGGNSTAVAGAYPGPVAVEDTGDRDADVVRLRVRGSGRFCESFCFVIRAARADRVDVAPVGLGLGVLQGVAVHLGAGRENQSCLFLPGQFQCVDGADASGFESLDRQAQVVGWRCWGGEVVDVIDLAVDAETFSDVVLDQGEAGARGQVLDVGGRSGDEVVQAGDVKAAGQQALA
jgi:hypothetical protein